MLTAPPHELVTRFHFRGGNREAVQCQALETVLCGPRGTGKSVAKCYKPFIIAERIPGARILIMRKTRASLTDSVMVTMEKHVIPRGHPCLGKTDRAHRRSYNFPNGSEIVFGGMGSADEKDKVKSTEWDYIYVNEATELREDEWEDLIPTLRSGVLPYQQIQADCNPGAPSHWIKRRADKGAIKLFNSQHKDNPWMWDEDRGDWTDAGRQYMETLNALTGVRRERFLYGRWAQAEGVVYEEWNPAIHMVKRFEIPRSWPRYRAVDYGFTNPFVCLWAATDEDGRIYIYRQIYMTKRIVEDHAAQIKRLSINEPYVRRTVADHDAEDNATMIRHGIPTTLAVKDTSTGREAVRAALRVQKDGRPRLFVLEDSLVEHDQALIEAKEPFALEQEFECYVFPKGRPTVNSKEEPIDKWDHGMDALRYLVMSLTHSKPIRDIYVPEVTGAARFRNI